MQQLLSSPAGASIAASMSASTANDSDDDITLLDMLLAIVIRTVALPDMMAILNGDLSSLDRTESEMYDVIVTLLNEEDSPAIRTAAAQYHAIALTNSVFTAEVLATRAAHLRPGAEPGTLAQPPVERSLIRLFDVVLSRHDTREAGGAEAAALPRFSEFLRQWGTDLIGSVIDVLVREAYTDGIVSVSAMIETALMARLNVAGGLGAMAPLLGGSVRKSLVTLYFTWKQKQQSTRASSAGAEAGTVAEQDEPWLAAVPAAERPIWRTVVAEDVAKMDAEEGAAKESTESKQDEVKEERKDETATDSSSTKPLSSVYRDGKSDGKLKRAGSHNMETEAAPSEEGSERLKRKMDEEPETEARKK